jgi:delta-aminolevulinic acid dehydratase/porphobilinogen synthase
MKTLQEYNGENDVVAIKQSKIREFVNEKNEEQDEHIYIATIVSIFVDESTGAEKETKYVVGLWATSTEKATKIAVDYMAQGLSDLVLVGIRRTNFVDII